MESTYTSATEGGICRMSTAHGTSNLYTNKKFSAFQRGGKRKGGGPPHVHCTRNIQPTGKSKAENVVPFGKEKRELNNLRMRSSLPWKLHNAWSVALYAMWQIIAKKRRSDAVQQRLFFGCAA